MKLFLVLGNQLFNPKYLKEYYGHTFYMSEDFDLCTFQKHHKLPLSNNDVKLDYILTEKGINFKK